MICPNCKAELTEDTRFCSYCGFEIVKEESNDEISSENNINQFNFSTATQMKSFDTPISSTKFFNNISKLSSFEKIIFIFTVISVLVAILCFVVGKIGAGIIAVLQFVLLLITFLMKKEIIKAPKSWLSICSLILAVILVFPFISVFTTDYGDAESFDWEDIVLCDVIPEPNSNFGEINSNSSDCLSLYIYKTSKSDFNDYIKECKDNGFIKDASQLSSRFDAYNEDGYKLSLYYYEDAKKMSISVTATERLDDLIWPVNSKMANLIPIPNSNKGKIEKDDDTCFIAYIGAFSLERFKSYTKECASNGFNNEMEETEKSFSAKNKDNYKLCIEYQGNDVIKITIYEPEYDVNLEIACTENWVFSTYDIKIYVNDEYKDLLKHGTTETFNYQFKKGSHIVKFENADDSSINGIAKLKITENSNFKFEIYCTNHGINITPIEGNIVEVETPNNSEETTKQITITNQQSSKSPDSSTIKIPKSSYDYQGTNYKDVVAELKKAGFTQIKTKVTYDLNTGKWDSFDILKVDTIKIGDTTVFDSGDSFKKESPIVITYHDLEINDPNIKYTSYTVKKLVSDLDSNAARAKEKHTNEFVKITGKIDTIDASGDYFLLIPTNDEFALIGVTCNIQTDNQLKKMKKYNKGDTVTVYGKITLVGEVLGYSLDIYKIG